MTSADQGDGIDVTSALDDRYGRSPARRARQRLLGWVAGVGVALTMVVWVVWVAFDGTSASIDSRMLGADIIGDTAVRITVEVSTPAGTETACALEVQNDTHAIVGWKIVELPASDRYTRTFTETVRTVDQGVTGLIYDCWAA